MSIKTVGWPFHDEDELAAVQKVLLSGNTNYWTGSEGREFEKEFAAYVGTPYAVALMNGTVALEAALYALGIGPGDEVIVPSRTFIASAGSIIRCGAIPVVADIDLDSQNLSVATIEPCITTRTKALMVVHLAGWPADMEAILELADKYHLKVIEDCAQAHGARLDERQVGSWGHVGAFSFCQDKILSTGGEGGMITTHDKTLWEKIWAFKDHGKNYEKIQRPHPPGFRWVHDSFGTNWRMTEMQAALGRMQLKKLPGWVKARKRNADLLTQALGDLPSLRIPLPPQGVEHAYYKYYVFVRPENLASGWNRDRIMQEMHARGLACYTGICGEIYREGAFIESRLEPIAPKPHAQQLAATSLMLLVHPTLTEGELLKVAGNLYEIMELATASVI